MSGAISLAIMEHDSLELSELQHPYTIDDEGYATFTAFGDELKKRDIPIVGSDGKRMHRLDIRGAYVNGKFDRFINAFVVGHPDDTLRYCPRLGAAK